ncbi:FAS1-like dehydratase domain-containing protein [Sphingobium fuliginis]|nr:MaoC family dehydratase N-terminal domain-containing protein [Sphingobium fuliginis]
MTGTMTMGSVSAAQIEEWQSFLGRNTEDCQLLDRMSLRRFLAVLGEDDDVVASEVPEMAHWAYFLPFTRNNEIGPDGHVMRGGFLPPISLPRRMFASGSTRFLAPLQLDRDATCRNAIIGIKHKTGRTGDLVFVEVERTFEQEGSLRLVERQTLVYREAGGQTPAPQLRDTGHEDALVWQPGPVDLFRFSAVTFNGHRIHYDSAYARDEEGYPDLVVHGPFTASMLCRAMVRAAPEQSLETFAFRAKAPLFVNQPIRLHVVRDGCTVKACAIRQDGEHAMTAEGSFR